MRLARAEGIAHAGACLLVARVVHDDRQDAVADEFAARAGQEVLRAEARLAVLHAQPDVAAAADEQQRRRFRLDAPHVGDEERLAHSFARLERDDFLRQDSGGKGEDSEKQSTAQIRLASRAAYPV